jgi:RNA polymerase sigma-70 factor (ECF subfamily)
MQSNPITDLLKAWRNGDMKALDELIPLVDPELKKIAHAYLRNEKPGHILQTTALVNEALIRLLPKNISYENRGHFYGFVARRMRQVLKDYARKAKRAKYVGLAGVGISEEKSDEVIRLEEALTKLAAINERQATIVEYRHFIGLKRKEVAGLLGLSETTVDREWSEARQWLKHEITGDAKS